MRIAIAANPQKPRALELARRAIDRVGGAAEIVGSPETAEALGGLVPSHELASLDADLVLSLGGDGTFLWTLQRTDLPILAVHAGTVGFLAEVDGERPEEFDRAIDRVVAGDYAIEERLKLAVQIGPRSLPDATNEVVVHSSQVAKMRQYELAVDGRPVGRVRADGLILATPTGSTSYALSALGPIVDPGIEAIVIAALAPFQVAHRTVLIDPRRAVTLRVVAPEKDAIVVVDGQEEYPLAPGEVLRVYRSPRRASFVRFGPGFFERLRGKGILPWREADVPPVA